MGKWQFLKTGAMRPPADMVANPLGASNLRKDELLIRESIQNTADERDLTSAEPPRYVIRRRQYLGKQKEALVNNLSLNDIVKHSSNFQPLGWFNVETTCLPELSNLNSPISVLTLSDFNTNGLGGKWDLNEGIESRFHNLILSLYNSGKAMDDTALGSYGLGKMVYALNSNIRTIAFYSSFNPTDETDAANTRFMASGFYPSHKFKDQDLSGYAFYGNPSKNREYPSEPTLDNDAHDLATSIGLEKRGKNKKGLTVMIIDCNTDPKDLIDICERFWWPKLISRKKADQITLEFFDENDKIGEVNPRQRDDLKPFIDCYSKLTSDPTDFKDKSYGAKNINLRGIGHVGNLRMKIIPDSETQLDDNVDDEKGPLEHTVALIRGGMVVQYNKEYGRFSGANAVGVFVPEESNKNALRAYKLSEPEAHDKWNENHPRLENALGEDGKATIRLTHKTIRSAYRDFQTRQEEVPKQNQEGGLKFLDDLLGKVFEEKKTGNPDNPVYPERAISIKDKKSTRDIASDPASDNLDVKISLMEGINVSSVTCEVKIKLQVIENASANKSTTIPCEVFDEDGNLLQSGTEPFKLDLKGNAYRKLTATAPIDKSWRTNWNINVIADEKTIVPDGGA